MYFLLNVLTVAVFSIMVPVIIGLLILDSRDRRRYESADGSAAPVGASKKG